MTEVRQLPVLESQPQVEFREDDFDALIALKGYDVIHERAIACPCKEEGGDNLPNCQNCLGTGWVFVSPFQTKMVLQSMNKSTKFKEWSEELRGTASVTAREVDQLAFMDRITAMNTQSIFSQVLYAKTVEIESVDVLFIRTIYNIDEILHFYYFSAVDEALVEVTQDYEYYNGQTNTIAFDPDDFIGIENLTFSITYKHKIQWHVIDIQNEMRQSQRVEADEFVVTNLPVHAIARRSHFVLDKNNIQGTLVIPN